jgi:hypothetical protein
MAGGEHFHTVPGSDAVGILDVVKFEVDLGAVAELVATSIPRFQV